LVYSRHDEEYKHLPVLLHYQEEIVGGYQSGTFVAVLGSRLASDGYEVEDYNSDLLEQHLRVGPNPIFGMDFPHHRNRGIT
jgi:hypothetical protein